MTQPRSTVIALSHAMPRTINMHGREVETSIVREPIPGPLTIVSDGPIDNLTAVHSEHMLVFNAEHYDFWAAEFGSDRADWDWCLWGENLTIKGINEEELRVGDVIRIGTAEFRVTSPRIPCFKVAWRVGQPDTVLPRMMETGRVGIHMEVLKPGEVAIGDTLEIEPAPTENVTLAELSRLLLSLSPDVLPQLKHTLALPALGTKAAGSVRQRITLIEDRERLRIGRWRGWKPFTICASVEETSGVKSFTLTPQDDEPLAPPAAGQFLTLRLGDDSQEAIVRPWSISGVDLDKRHYRLSIKLLEGGAGSTRIHDMAVGDTVWARPPAGQFTLDRSGFRRIGLISAGIGVTPMLAMLVGHLERGDNAPPLIWVQIVPNGDEHPFKDEVERLLAQGKRIERHIFYTRPGSKDRLGIDYDHVGRPDADMLGKLLGAPYILAPFGREVPLPGKETEFYLCGPAAFESAVREGLQSAGVKPGNVRSESFLPAAADGAPTAPVVERATLSFTEAGVEAEWYADDGMTLLDAAEAAGLSPLYACRTGVCQSCSCTLVSGAVSYSPAPPVAPADGQVLICCARPASKRIELAL